ncbi:MAG: cytochrome c3 family protein [Anaerolineales bacterium]
MLNKFNLKNLFEKIKVLLKKPLFLIGVGTFFVLILSAGIYGVWRLQQSPPQPIQFNHEVHVGFGVQCLYCHPGAWKQASAGLPTSAKCWGCHQQIPIKNAEQQKLADYVASGESIPWVPVFIQPDFVYFNHRPHIAYGLNCETCHGEISREKVAVARSGQNMGWCLRCHREKFANDPVKFTKLTDCATCHR